MGKSNLSFRGPSSPVRHTAVVIRSSLVSVAAATRSETAKPALITFRETRRKKWRIRFRPRRLNFNAPRRQEDPQTPVGLEFQTTAEHFVVRD